MNTQELLEILKKIEQKEISPEEAVLKLSYSPFQKTNSAHLDTQREARRGFPEVVFGQGKSKEQLLDIFTHHSQNHSITLATRVSSEQSVLLQQHFPAIHYKPESKMLFLAPEKIKNRGRGEILVICAGTSDIPVAQEAYLTALLMGNSVRLIQDVGIAGLQRILHYIEDIRSAEVVLVVAGMEGALPSVVAGLCDRPVIGVPTSIGYGASQGGYTAMLGMLSSCVAGLTVVNIDNGFGAGYHASLINRNRQQKEDAFLLLQDYL